MKSGLPQKPEAEQGYANGWERACKVEAVSRQTQHAVIPRK